MVFVYFGCVNKIMPIASIDFFALRAYQAFVKEDKSIRCCVLLERNLFFVVSQNIQGCPRNRGSCPLFVIFVVE
jgi:hypothetical protein